MRNGNLDRCTKHSVGWWFSAIALVSCVLIGVGVWIWAARRGLADVSQGLVAARPYLFLWRMLLFAGLIGGWHFWIALWARGRPVDAATYVHLVVLRWQVAIVLLLAEVLIGQNLLSTVANSWLGSAS